MKLYVLGTGMAMVQENFNNCFVMENNNRLMLVDAGGGSRILAQLKKTSISIYEIESAFISHNHSDHLLGFAWVLRQVLVGFMMGKRTKNLTIFGSEECLRAVREITIFTMGEELCNKFFDKKILFKNIVDNQKEKIIGLPFTFFETYATDMHQMGFFIKNDFVFAGDVPLDERYYKKFANAKYLCLEAFCLESERSGRELPLKKHKTVEQASQVGETLKVQNLILWHTSDNLGKKRKKVYSKEAKKYYNGNLIIPEDLDVLEIEM